ncbi:hypothetical protein BH11MYX3_BH11MYX3_30530 [soil metagenome]
MRVSTILISLALIACDKPTPAGMTTAALPVAAPPIAAPPSAPVAGAPVAAAPIAAVAVPVAPKTAGDVGDPTPPAGGPPSITRMIPSAEIRASAPFGRGDYLIALDYREEGFGTYGYLYSGDGTWWVVEQDVVVGGPIPDGGATMQQVTARWGEGERQRHAAVMRGVASAPHGCLDGCVFDAYQNGQWAGRRIEY